MKDETVESGRQPVRVLKPAEHEPHIGKPVRVGKFQILLGGTQFLKAEHLRDADVLLPLTECRLTFGQWYRKPMGVNERYHELPPMEPDLEYNILAAPLKDFGGVPNNWGDFVKTEVVPLITQGHKVLAFCAGSHGRTGTLLATLISIMEPKCKDPIAAARFRHCPRCIETKAQAEAIFALKGLPLPPQWVGKFHR